MEKTDIRKFDPVRLKLRGRNRVVRSVHDAYRMMVTEWPVADGPALYRAEVTCLDVFNGVVGAREARKKFIAAVNEAHLPYMD